jgi:hypothetical protein
MTHSKTGSCVILKAIRFLVSGYRGKAIVRQAETTQHPIQLKTLRPEGDPLVNADLVSDDTGFPDHDSGSVIDEKLSPMAEST